jgi:hypothetical protein
MSGTNTKEALGRGINYRALDDLFGIRDNRPEVGMTRLGHSENMPIRGIKQRGVQQLCNVQPLLYVRGCAVACKAKG